MPGRNAYLAELNAWRDGKENGRKTRYIGNYSTDEKILKVAHGLPASWRESKRRPYHSISQARADAGITGDLRKFDAEDAEDEDAEDEDDKEDTTCHIDIAWLKQLARIQFIASGELNEDVAYRHLPPNMQTPKCFKHIHQASREVSQNLCAEKGLAIVM